MEGGSPEESKLRLYRTLKNDLRRESYLALPLESRRKLTEMRSGTQGLRIETGRWEKEPLEERMCKVCVCGPIEDEVACPVGLLPLWEATTANVPGNGQDGVRSALDVGRPGMA